MMCRFVYAAGITLCLTGCANLNFNPRPGVSYEDWKRDAALAVRGMPELVGMKGSTTVYYLPASQNNKNTFYWFDNGRLAQVTQGELPQVRVQIENINR